MKTSHPLSILALLHYVIALIALLQYVIEVINIYRI